MFHQYAEADIMLQVYKRKIPISGARLLLAVLGNTAEGAGFNGPERRDRAEIDAAGHGAGARKQIGERVG